MSYSKVYGRINWVNKPDGLTTPLGAVNLNKIDHGLDTADNRIIELESLKADKSTVLKMVSDWTMNKDTGIITVTKQNGDKIMFDLNIEKIPVSFSLSDLGILSMRTQDGTVFNADIGSMIPILTFKSSDTVAITTTGTGINKTYTFAVKDGSITEDKLQPNYLADVRLEKAKAESAQVSAAESAASAASKAKLSESYAKGGTGTRAGENTDNAKYYAEQAKAVSSVSIATTSQAGIVKPDGTTIDVESDGTIKVQDDNMFNARRGAIQQADLDKFASLKSGCYYVNNTNESNLLTVFAPNGGSASALQIYSNYPLSALKVRGAIDNNRYTEWRFVAFTDWVEANYLKSANILSTKEQVQANTQKGRVADALVTKEILSNLNVKVSSFDVETGTLNLIGI